MEDWVHKNEKLMVNQHCPLVVMNKKEAQNILKAELVKFRAMAFQEMIAKLGNQGCWDIAGQSGANYQIEIDKPSLIYF